MPVWRNVTAPWEAALSAVGLPAGSLGSVVSVPLGASEPANETALLLANVARGGAPWDAAGLANTALEVHHVPDSETVTVTAAGSATLQGVGATPHAGAGPEEAACAVPFNYTAPGVSCETSRLTVSGGAAMLGQLFTWFQLEVAGSTLPIHGLAMTSLPLFQGNQPGNVLFQWVRTDMPFNPQQILTDPLFPDHLMMLFVEDSAVYLARINARNTYITEPTLYEYWTSNQAGSGYPYWSDLKSDAVPLLTGVASLSVAWSRYLRRYVLLSSSDDSELGRMLFASTAPHVWQPWSARSLVFHLPGGVAPDHTGQVIDPNWIPVLFDSGDRRMYFTYSVVGSGIAARIAELTLCSAEDAKISSACLWSAALAANHTAPMTPTCQHDAFQLPWVAIGIVAGGLQLMVICMFVLSTPSDRHGQKDD